MPENWAGMRWQASFAVPGEARGHEVDATTTPAGRVWAARIAHGLEGLGYVVHQGQDEGADAEGAPTLYDELDVAVGEGHVALAFFADEVFWSVEVFPDQCTREAAERAARDIREVVESVTGYALQTGTLTSATRALLGLR